MKFLAKSTLAAVTALAFSSSAFAQCENPWGTTDFQASVDPSLHCLAVGEGSGSYDVGALSFGAAALASGAYTLAMGYNPIAVGERSVALGNYSRTDGTDAVAIGTKANGQGVGATSIGPNTRAQYDGGIAIGSSATSTGYYAIAIGTNTSVANSGVALGYTAAATASNSVAVGSFAKTTADSAVAFGTSAYAPNIGASALGTGSMATADRAAAIGYQSTASGVNSVAVGYKSKATGTLEFSVGDASQGLSRRVTNLADGVSSTDAATLGQLQGVQAVANSASSLATAAKTAGDNAKIAADAATTGIDVLSAQAVRYATDNRDLVSFGTAGRPVTLGNVANGVNDSDAATVGQVKTAQVVAENASAAVASLSQEAVLYDGADRARVSFGTSGNRVRLSNVADGMAADDAATKGQLDAVAAQVASGAALGLAYSDATKAEVSLAGDAGTRIHNVAAGVDDSDAATVGQLRSFQLGAGAVAAALGGGAGFGSDGVFRAPAYLVQGGTYGSVGDALGAVDAGLTRSSQAVATLDGRLTSSLAQLGTSNGAGSEALQALQARVDTLEKGQGTGGAGGVAVGGGGEKATVVDKTNGVAVGGKASAGGQNATAVGGNSFAAGPGDTAIGGGATVNADYSTAVGSNTRVASVATHAVAVGANASVSQDHSVALGEASRATAQNAVAIGAGSVADRDSTVSVGAAGQERAITNVAAGTMPTDAANTAQVNAAIDTAKSYTDQRFSELQAGLDRYSRVLDDRFRTVDRRLNGTGAMATAMSQMGTAAAGASGNGRLAAGVGLQGGERAIAVGYATTLGESERVHFNFGGAATSSQRTVGAGVGVDL